MYKPDDKPIFNWVTQYNIQQSSQKACPQEALVVFDFVQRWKHTGQYSDLDVYRVREIIYPCKSDFF